MRQASRRHREGVRRHQKRRSDAAIRRTRKQSDANQGGLAWTVTKRRTHHTRTHASVSQETSWWWASFM